MLNVLLMDYDFYQRKGLSTLISNEISDKGNDRVFFLSPSQKESQDIADIIFRNDMVTIHVKHKKQECETLELIDKSEKITIHVPFTLRNQCLNDVFVKVKKILALASADYCSLTNIEEACRKLGVKQYAQLSDAENDVMIMIGRGYDNNEISRVMNRSIKTISTHYRNASRKIGVSNRADFYRFASYVASCRRDERNTICL
ncbi:LuxR family transcriptional regulator [Pantoea allii]|nr:helix-turn-helix transcriptional regulator [Pantoea allii]THB83440.1 LuxR family transcriptional regulator [Pantoea allii]